MFTAEVVEKRALTPVVRHVTLQLTEPEAFTFTPGQFLQFILDARTLRQFSFASPPSQLPRFELCVDISPMGRGSRFLEELHPGSRVTFRGPFGVFTIPGGEQRPLEFVATGAGIAPIRAMITALCERGNPLAQPVTLTFGNRTPADLLYGAEWRALAARLPTFRYVPTLSQTPADWEGERGRVTEVLARRVDLANKSFFLCGAPAMVDDVRTVLTARGIPEGDIHFEKFY